MEETDRRLLDEAANVRLVLIARAYGYRVSMSDFG
jgi:hypothetical protein